MIQYRNLCAMYQQYFQSYHTPMVPPLVFERQHQYATQTTELLAQPPKNRLAFSQRLFSMQIAQWWNAVSNDILTSSTIRDTF